MQRPHRQLRQVLRPLAKKFGPGVQELQLRWHEIAGARLSKLTFPEKLTGSGGAQTLVVRAEGPAALAVEAQSAQLLERIALIAGRDRITRIRLVQGKVQKRVTRKPQYDAQTTRGETPEEAKELDTQLADMPEGSLKSALRELGRQIILHSAKRNTPCDK